MNKKDRIEFARNSLKGIFNYYKIDENLDFLIKVKDIPCLYIFVLRFVFSNRYRYPIDKARLNEIIPIIESCDDDKIIYYVNLVKYTKLGNKEKLKRKLKKYGKFEIYKHDLQM